MRRRVIRGESVNTGALGTLQALCQFSRNPVNTIDIKYLAPAESKGAGERQPEGARERTKLGRRVERLHR